MSCLKIPLRYVPYPNHPLCKKHQQSLVSSKKPPLYRNYDRARTLNQLSVEWYRHYLSKRCEMACQKPPTRLHLPVERQLPSPKNSTPYENLLTPHAVTTGPTRLERIFGKGESYTRRDIPARQQIQSKGGNLLGGLMYKARVGPNQLIRQDSREKANGSQKGCDGNGTNGGKADKRIASGQFKTLKNQEMRTCGKKRLRMERGNSQSGSVITKNSRLSLRSCSPPIPRRVTRKKKYASGSNQRINSSVKTVSRKVKKPRVENVTVQKSMIRDSTVLASQTDDKKIDLVNRLCVTRPSIVDVNHTCKPRSTIKDVSNVTRLDKRRRGTVEKTLRTKKKLRIDHTQFKLNSSCGKDVTKPIRLGNYHHQIDDSVYQDNVSVSSTEKIGSLPLKKRCDDRQVIKHNRYKKNITQVTSTRKESENTDSLKTSTMNASRRRGLVMESPVSITQNPFVVKPVKTTSVKNHVTRCLSFERRPKDISKPLLFIADPTREHRLRSAFNAVSLKTLEETFVSCDSYAKHYSSHSSMSRDNWEITFM